MELEISDLQSDCNMRSEKVISGIFADNFQRWKQRGWAPLICHPCTKKPIPNQFQTWDRNKAVTQAFGMVRRSPNGNMAMLMGQSRVIAVDPDEYAAAELADMFGRSPMMTRGQRFEMRYFRDDRGAARGINFLPHGLEMQIKAGPADYVMVPPSIHPNTLAPYTFPRLEHPMGINFFTHRPQIVVGDIPFVEHLPPFPWDVLEEIKRMVIHERQFALRREEQADLEGDAKRREAADEERRKEPIRKSAQPAMSQPTKVSGKLLGARITAGRRLAIDTELVGIVATCATKAEALAKARAFNQERCSPAVADSEVLKRTARAWKRRGLFTAPKKKAGPRNVVDFADLKAMGSRANDFEMLAWVRLKNGERPAPFRLDAKSIAAAKDAPRDQKFIVAWTKRALAAKVIVRVTEATEKRVAGKPWLVGHREAATYTLAHKQWATPAVTSDDMKALACLKPYSAASLALLAYLRATVDLGAADFTADQVEARAATGLGRDLIARALAGLNSCGLLKEAAAVKTKGRPAKRYSFLAAGGTVEADVERRELVAA